MSGPFILCDGLVKIYRIAGREVVALQGLELTVERGEVVGLVGPSGAGKTTLLNLIGGLDRPTAGRVMVDGQDLTTLSDRALDRYRRQEVGFVWQQSGRNLLPYLTARQNVELPMLLAGLPAREREARVQALLEAVGLDARQHHRMAELSGGEQQRVAIAVALANHPPLLLADEPTGELDSATARTIYETFRRLNATLGLTLLIVTHDPDITAWVDRVVAIRDGKTSTERRVLRPEPPAGPPPTTEAEPAPSSAGAYVEYVVVDSAGRLQIPPEYRERLGIGDRVVVEVVEEGLLIRPVGLREEGPPQRKRPAFPPSEGRAPT